MKALSRLQPPSVTYVAGATTPVGSFGEVVWSTAANGYLQWRGSSWMIMPRVAVAADGAPPAIAAAGSVGSTGIAADAAHTHAHGNQAGGALHALADNTNAGFLSAAQWAIIQTLGFGAFTTAGTFGMSDRIPKTTIDGVIDLSFINTHHYWQGAGSIDVPIAGSPDVNGKLDPGFINDVPYQNHVFVPSTVTTQDTNNVIFHTRTYCGKQFMALLGAEPLGNVGFGRPGPRLLESSNMTVDKGYYQPAGDTNLTTNSTQTGFFAGMGVTGTQAARTATTGGTNGSNLRRGGLVTTTTIGNTSHFFLPGTGINAVWRSANINDGGFFFTARIVVAAVSAAMRWFVGLYSGAAVLGSVNISAQAGLLGFGVDTADTTLQFFTGVLNGKINIASTTPKTAGTTFDLWMYHPAGGGILYGYRTPVANDTSPTIVNPGAITWLTAGTKVKPYVYVGNSTNATAVGIDVCGMYMEVEA